MASGNEMRVGDAEREAAAAELREHYASGRLTLDELNERIDKAFAAKTRGDLNVLMTDLPSRRPEAGRGAGAIGAAALRRAGRSVRDRRAVRTERAVRARRGWLELGSAGSGAGADGGVRLRHDAGGRRAVHVRHRLARSAFGTGRPIGIVLILAAFGLLRRLFFRRRAGGCGPRGRRRW